MYFTRTDTTYRAWFQVIKLDGTLRKNAPNDSFDVAIINSADNAFISCSVTESVQHPGLYYFDVPTSFLLTNGAGDYAASVEVNITGSPTVLASFTEKIKVTKEDWDSLSGSVWNTTANLFNVSGTMGYLQNQIGATSISASVVVDVPAIVSGVWNANTPTFNTTNSTGWFQNKIGTISSSLNAMQTTLNFISSSVQNVVVSTGSISAIVNSVWSEPSSLYNVSGTFGFILSGTSNSSANITAIATKVTEIYQLMGLEVGSALTVTPTSRGVAAITQSFAGDPVVSITVTRL